MYNQALPGRDSIHKKSSARSLVVDLLGRRTLRRAFGAASCLHTRSCGPFRSASDGTGTSKDRGVLRWRISCSLSCRTLRVLAGDSVCCGLSCGLQTGAVRASDVVPPRARVGCRRSCPRSPETPQGQAPPTTPALSAQIPQRFPYRLVYVHPNTESDTSVHKKHRKGVPPLDRGRSEWHAAHKSVGAGFKPAPTLGLHTFDQTCTPLWRVEGLGVVAGVAPDLAVFQLEYGHDGEDPSFAVVVDTL